MVKYSGGEKSASSCSMKSGKFSKGYRNRKLLHFHLFSSNFLYYPGFFGTSFQLVLLNVTFNLYVPAFTFKMHPKLLSNLKIVFFMYRNSSMYRNCSF